MDGGEDATDGLWVRAGCGPDRYRQAARFSGTLNKKMSFARKDTERVVKAKALT